MDRKYDAAVGRGAFGEVWRATDAIGRQLAVKFSREHNGDLSGGASAVAVVTCLEEGLAAIHSQGLTHCVRDKSYAKISNRF